MEHLIYNKISYDIGKYKDLLLEEINNKESFFKTYAYKFAGDVVVWPYHGEFRTVRNEDIEDCPVLKQVEKEFNNKYHINAEGRYYTLPPEYELTPHKDFGTKCAINFILKGSSPIVFHEALTEAAAEGNNYRIVHQQNSSLMNYKIVHKQAYDQALLNLQELHSVPKSSTGRILLKFSIFDESYEEVLRKIKYYD